MNAFASAILFFAIVLGAAGVIYYLVHHTLKFPNMGRISATLTLALGTMLDQFNMLPWGQILSDAQAKMVGFALALGLCLMKVVDMLKTANAPPAPPAA